MPLISSFPGGSGSGGGGGIPLVNVTGIDTVAAHNKVYLKWTDPDDIAPEGQMIAEWAGTMLICKAGSAPKNRNDGRVVIDCRERNKYKDEYLCDTGVTDGIEYFYKFFPYTTGGVYTDRAEDEVQVTPAATKPGNVSGLHAESSGGGKVTVTWTDPEDITDRGITLCKWGGTKVVYKAGEAPASSEDGELAINSTTKNQYSSSGYTVTGLENDTEYYFGVFPYGDVDSGNLENDDPANIVQATPELVVIENVPEQDGTLTYNGDQQEPKWKNRNEAGLDIGGRTNATDAGEYTATFTPKAGDYKWYDGSIDAKEAKWHIDKAAPAAPRADKQTIELNAQKLRDTFTVTRDGDGTISVEMDQQGIITASVASDVVTVESVDSKTGNVTLTIKVAASKNYEAYTGTGATVTVNAKFMPDKKALNDTSWADIDAVSAAGQAANYWAVGHRKALKISGTVGTEPIDATFYVVILGIDHNAEIEGKGIHFGGFKTDLENGTDICLVDSHYGSYDNTGLKWFNMNHWGGSSSPYNTNYGGWAACDARYDILGSTNQKPTPYGSTKTLDATGKDPTDTCATDPVPGTLMAALPAELRAVMKPMTKYTDNKGNMGTSAEAVTKTIDYLPLLAEFEIHGSSSSSYLNQNEKTYQKQYAYYEAGNSKVKYKHSATGSSCGWWARSPSTSDAGIFRFVTSNGSTGNIGSRASYGLAPAFKI